MPVPVRRRTIALLALTLIVGCCNIPGRGWNRECCNHQSCFCYAPKLESCPSCRNSCVECKNCCENGPACRPLPSRQFGFTHWLIHGVTLGQSGPVGCQANDCRAAEASPVAREFIAPRAAQTK